MDPTKAIIKYKNFSFYEDRYLRKLRQPACVVDPLITLCGGWFLQTFKQVINKLSTNKTSPLPLYFPTIDSMQLITKNRSLLQQIFKSFDTRKLQRIDACEVYCALLVLSKGSYQIFLKTIVDVFGFQYPSRISKDQFFYFLDCFFRAIPKIVILKGYQHSIEPNIRLQHQDLERFVKEVFGAKLQIERNQIYEMFMNSPKLSQFIKYIQKKCTMAAEVSRNNTIEKLTLQAEVRACLGHILEQVQHEHRKQMHFQRILQ